MLISGTKRLTYSDIRDELQNTVFLTDESKGDESDPSELELALENLFGEVTRRQRSCGKEYPFRVERTGMAIRLATARRGATYLFLLLISVSLSFRAERRYREIDEPFDLLTLEALRAYFGRLSRAVRFGSPASGDRPRYFDKAIPWLWGEMELRPGELAPRHHTGDGGADVVLWIPFQSGGEAFFAILTQCTVEREWHAKASDLNPLLWRSWISFGQLPAVALSVPFVVPTSSTKWNEIRMSAAVILERLRLARLVRKPPMDLVVVMLTWSANELRKLGARDLKHVLTLVSPQVRTHVRKALKVSSTKRARKD